MSPEAFQADVDVAKRQVEAAERRGFWMRLLTFGLLDNREVTAFARESPAPELSWTLVCFR